jgi:endonuclease YncB( thermonuclease family)
MRARFFGLLCLLLPAAPAGPLPAAEPPSLEFAGQARVVEVVDGDTVVLDDGRQVRLVGIQAPKLPLGRTGFATWPLAHEAKAALEALVQGRTVTLGHGGRRIDRHGRALAHLYLGEAGPPPDGWVQGALLEQGLARVYSFADNRALTADMLARERGARRAGRGIWADAFYAIRRPEEALGHVGSFQIVEGHVVGAAIVRGRAYLNFGEDWRSDFTVTLSPAVRRRFERDGIDPISYGSRRVRVRGWIKSFNGAMIEASHPEQIEVIEE